MNRINIVCLVTIVGTATPATASEHQMVVNEIMRSSGGDEAAQLIELRDMGDEPFANATYAVDVFDAEAVLVGRVPTPGITGGNGPRFYVLSTAAADGKLGITGDGVLTTTLPGDGQACFIGTNDRKIHCVAWGCINVKVTPATPLGASPPDGMSLQRTPSGAELTIAAPTPGADNSQGTMDDPCPVGPTPDQDVPDPDPGGGCCEATGSAPSGAVGTILVLFGLTLLGRRRLRCGGA